MMENYENVRALGFPTNNPDLVFKMRRNENHELYTDKIENGVSLEGVSPEGTGELEFSNEKKKLATWREKDMQDALPSVPTSLRLLESCGATVKGRSPRKERRARSFWLQTMPGFVCPDCGKAFLSKSDMARHQWYHSRKKPCQSLSCPKSLAKPSQPAQQQPRPPGECQCSKCGKRFMDCRGLMCHQAVHAAKQTFHRHAHCRGFYFNYNLRQHQNPNQQVSTAKPLFHCPHCGRQFTRRCNLIQHSRIHQYLWHPQGKRWTPTLETKPNETMEVQVGYCA
ncbi:hypothetical protein L345_11063 [Ophiophagus hannah]|uniref:C2H2-type domain-containing protein n=1 Tax=Ophiophagus hannah TaxID=8665 RepID=V8NNR9_OPHHA|nr:hypothetical protein L345_11063 [Ophiophagus hannah]